MQVVYRFEDLLLETSTIVSHFEHFKRLDVLYSIQDVSYGDARWVVRFREW